MMLVMGISNLFANNFEGVNEQVLKSFNKEFALAREVNWEVNKQFIKVNFSLNGQILIAYYSADGERIAMARNVTTPQLPMSLNNGLKESYSGYWVTDLFELTRKGESTYYVTIENADQKIILNSLGIDGWAKYKSEKK